MRDRYIIVLLLLGLLSLSTAGMVFFDTPAVPSVIPGNTHDGDGFEYKEYLAEDVEPTEERYVNTYSGEGEPPSWIPESEHHKDEYRFSAPVFEVTRYPNATPTAEHLEASWRLYNETFDAAEENGWFEYDHAVEQGYVDHLHGDGLHHYNFSYLLDGEMLNPEKPEVLVYYDDPEDDGDKILTGVMYENVKKEGEQVGGPLTVWHYHPSPVKGKRRVLEDLKEETRFENITQAFKEAYDGDVPDDRLNRSGEMIHVWFVEHPGGPFATRMAVPSDALGKPHKMTEEEFKIDAIEGLRKRYNGSEGR